MQGRPPEFDPTISQSGHTPVSRVSVIEDGKITRYLPTHAGAVTADRMAAQMRAFEVEVSDPDGTLTPTGMDSDLAPFGRRVLVERGVLTSNVQVQSVLYNAANPWSAGVFVSVKVDGSGSLTLGP